MLASAAIVPVVLAVSGVLVAAQDPNDGRSSSHTSAVIGLVIALVFLFCICCCVQRRRIQRAAVRPPGALPLASSSRFPHGIQYGQTQAPYGNPAYTHLTPMGTAPYVPAGSEYPSAAAADFAPPPYVKEGGDGALQYAPPLGPPPGIDAVYSPPPGPPPRAHISV
ncbi:hypothetical protein B0H19DRAFT_1195205 [Mycena capillaripes]|nr:hypothetical protein B0H19DRAFT_1195205 [Mycena capillaripes]